MEQRIDFERNVVSWNAKSSTRGQMMKFHRGQKWLSSRSTDLEISLLPCISLLSDGEPIELDRLLDREGGFSPKLGMSLSPLSPLQTWPTFILLFSLPADRISRYFQLSRCLPRNLRSEDRGNCLEVALDLSLGNQKHRRAEEGDENFVARKFEYVHVVHLLFPRKDRFGNSSSCDPFWTSLYILSYIVDMDRYFFN